jgi:hypothetical protein
MEPVVMTKTTRITVETETQLVIRRAKAISAWCPGCRAEVDAIALDNDSLAGSITAAQIQEWLATNKLHFWQAANEPTHICLISLFRCFELGEVQTFAEPKTH